MTPRIETSNEKKLVGKRLIMSFANYKIGELWRSFMPRRIFSQTISVNYNKNENIFKVLLPNF